MKTITVVHCWSAPRSRSTALLYSFEALGDDKCIPFDEPLYREYLEAKKESLTRPYLEDLIAGTPPEGEDDPERWRRELLSLSERLELGAAKLKATPGEGVIFCKHMAKHAFLYDFDNEYKLTGTPEVELLHRHVLLIRDPVTVLSAWGAVGEVHGNSPSSEEIGVVSLMSIYSELESKTDQPILVIDSDELAKDPKGSLLDLCERLSIDYSDSMLSWAEGEHKCDGPWAKCSQVDWVELIPKEKISHTESRTDARIANLDAGLSIPFASHNSLSKTGPSCNPWDSSVQGGDGCWEGIRVYNGRIMSLDKHLRRLFRSAKALGFENVHTKEEVTEAIFQTLAANGMRNDAHMRLTLSRGEKYTSSMNPVFNVYGTTLIILPEWKPTEGATTYDNTKGISLISASQRRNSPSTCDSKIHHNNMINNILPKIQANLAGCADAIMLDMDGYVSETNATNIFMVDDEGVLLTPHGDHCLPGVTRGTVLVLAKELGIPHEVRRVSLAEFHAAEEVFTTGTMGELTPVTNIDGRVIGTGVRGPITKQLQDAYKALPAKPEWSTEIPPFTES
ncbi:unnamed protein product [Pseudo-nitzschia multistriata]|uniref:Branched-chain-amino-acid transaminase n=1 Tax=Pseudo-nitzschia multistriata TaxID=183589 RepID=A0A448Z231_9STRA|nr:unnamed protein product [Pseudo-nitzschia multistriata]